MKKTFKRSLSILLSVLMVLSVLSAGMISTLAEDKELTMIAVVAMKPEEGAEYCTTRFIFNATEEDLTALNGGPVDLSSYGYEAQWGILPATSENPHERVDGNWGMNTWGYDENGNLYFATKFPLIGGTTPAEEYAAAGRGELAGIVREFADAAVQDGIVKDALGRAFCPDLKANTILDGMDAVRQVLTTDEVYYAKPVTTKTVMLNNCDSAEGWAPYPGDGLEVTTEKKTEGTGSIRTSQSGGFCQGGPIAGLDLTGIQSISFDFAANTAEALTGPADVAFYLFSGNDGINPERGDRYFELNEVDTSKVMAFDVAAIRAGYGKGDESFATITTTPVSTGENFDITNVTGFYFWGCTAYNGDHVQWLDNVVANIAVQSDAAVDAVIAAIDALPEAADVVIGNKADILAAKAAYDALTDEQKANVTNAEKLTAVVAALEALKVKDQIVLDECTEASVANWKAADNCAWQGDAINIWWPLRARVKFAEVKNLTGIESVFIDWTGSSQESEFGGDSPFETVFSREVADPDQYGMVLTSFDGDLPVVEKISDSEAYTDYGVRLTVNGDVVAGENTFAVDLSTAGAKFDITKVTGMVFVGRPGGQSAYFHALKANTSAWPVDAAVAGVIAAIDALPAAADVTLGDADAINAAKAAFDALTDIQKAEVTNAAKLTAAKEALDALMAQADKIGVKFVWAYSTIYGDNNKFEVEAGKTLTVKAKINAVGGSDQRYFGYLQLLGDAGSNHAGSRLNIADYEALATEHNSRYGYDYKTLVSEIAVDAADNYKASFVYGGRKSADIPNAALTVYEIEVYDGETLLTSFCPADDGVNIEIEPEQAGEKDTNWVYVYGIKNLTPAEQVDELIDALPAPGSLTINDLKALAAAKEAYNALTDEQKAEVKGTEKLNALLAEEEEKFKDIIDQLAAKIMALPEPDEVSAEEDDLAELKVKLDEIDTITRSLTRPQATEFKNKYPELPGKLSKVKQAYQARIIVKGDIMCTCEKDTEDVFDFVGNDHAMKDGTFWMNVTVGGVAYPNVDLFNSVYVRVGRYFGEDAYTHSFNYNDYYQFEFLVNPDKDNTFYITHGNEDNGIEWQYPSVISVKGNEWQRASCLISDIGTTVVQNMTPKYGLDNVNLLHIGQANSGEFYMKDIAVVSFAYAQRRANAEKKFIDAVAAIGTVTAESGDAIEAAKTAREALNNWINTATAENLAASATLDRAILEYALLDPDNADVRAVHEKIIALPEAKDVTLDNEAAIVDAGNAFDALTDAKKDMLPTEETNKLAAVRKAFDIIKKVKPVEDLIDALTEPGDINYTNLNDVKSKYDEAKAAFDALTEELQDNVNNKEKLFAVGEKITELTDDIAAAKAVEDLIDALPAVDAELTDADKANIVAANARFTTLTDAQKDLVPKEKKDKLAKLVERISQPPVPTVKYGDVDGNGTIDSTDALWALQAFVGSRTLDEAAAKAADVNLDGVVDTSDALAILQYFVQLRTELPVKAATAE